MLLAMGVSITQPLTSVGSVQAATPDAVIKVTEDKMKDVLGHYPNGIQSSPFNNVNFIGYQRDDLEDYGASEVYLKFDLSKDPGYLPSKKIDQALLKVFVVRKDTDPDPPFIDLYGSNEDNWSESEIIKTGTKDVEIKRNDTSAVAGAWKTFDVTSYVNSQVEANDKVISFTLAGYQGPVNKTFAAVQYGIYDDSAVSNSAVLELTYAQNQPPTEINLAHSTVPENTAAGTAVGTLTTVDPDPGDTATYTIVSGDVDKFYISGNVLTTNAVFDYETKNSYTVRVRATDSANNVFEKDFTITVSNVNESPSGSVSINNSETISNTNNVILNLTKSDPDAGDNLQMQFSNDNSTWSPWEPFTTSKAWTFTPGDGSRTVYMRLRDSALLQSPVYSDSIVVDTTNPTGTLTINSGELVTNSRNITLHLSGNDPNGPLEVRFTEGNGTPTAWMTYPSSNTYPWTLSTGDGVKTIKLELKDAAGNISEVSQSITLDQTPPTITVTGVQNGKVTNQNVEITFEAESTATLNGSSFVSGTTVTEEGAYELIVTDSVGNTANFSFSIDKTPPAATLSIDDGKKTTKSTNVTLQMKDVTGSPAEMRMQNGTGTWSSWVSFDPNKVWTLENDVDGVRTVTVEIKDAAGNIASVNDTIIVDTVAPTGSITINSEAVSTNKQAVTLQVAASDSNDDVEVRFGNEDGSWTTWKAINDDLTENWTLSAGDGTKTVKIELKDSAGNVSSYSDTILLDTSAPTVTGVTNGGVYNSGVSASFTDGTATLNGEVYTDGTPINDEGSYTLVVTDAAGNSTTISFSIDKTKPVGTFVFAGGNTYTKDLNINLSITHDSDAKEMQFSNDNTTWSPWVTIQSTASWTLEGTDGLKTVYMKVRDAAHNESDVYSKTITLDTKAPTGSISINNGSSYTKSENVTLDIEGQDENGTVQMQFQKEDSTWTDWELVSASKDWTLGGTDGTKTVKMQLMDEAGNISSFDDTITLDKINPVVNGVSDGAKYNTDVTITFEAEATAELDGSTFTSGGQVSTEGSHNLSVTDLAGNVTSISFIIDKTKPTGTLSINNGDTHTNSVDVTLYMTASDNQDGIKMSFSNNGVDWSTPVTFQSTADWKLDTADGNKTVYLKVLDGAGNEEVYTDTIELDTTKPLISGVSNGQSYSTDVTITFTEGTATLNGQPFVSGTTVTDEGSYVLIVTDEAGNSMTVNFTIDKSAPTSAISILDGAAYTASTAVTLFVSNVQTGDMMRIANEDKVWSEWIPVSATHAWNLSAGDGVKTVHLEVKDLASNIHPSSDTIVLDTGKPTGTISINSGASLTKQTDVTLDVTAADANGDPKVRFSNGGDLWSEWQTVTSLVAWKLSGEDGVKTVTMEILDEAGNTESVSDTIQLDATGPNVHGVQDGRAYNHDVTITFDEGTAQLNGQPFVSGTSVTDEGAYTLVVTDDAGNKTTIHFTVDKTPPAGTLSINNGAVATNSTQVQLKLSSVTESGTMRFSNDGNTWGDDWVPTGSTADWTLENGDGTKTVYVQLRDEALNMYDTNASIELDTVAPIVSGVSEDQVTNTDVTITFNEGTATLNGEPFMSGSTVSQDGDYTLVVTDAAGNKTTVHFTVDKDAPSGTFKINNGASATNQTEVTLNLNGVQGPAKMRISNDGAAWTDWEDVVESKVWNLPDGEGLKTVYLEIRDQALNVSSFSDTIVLDTTAPIIRGVSNGEVYDKPVTITYNEGSAKLNGEPFASGNTVSANGDYSLTVTDEAGNTTSVRFTIKQEAVVITGTISINNNAPVTFTRDVTLTVTMDSSNRSDDVSMRFSNDKEDWSSWVPFASSYEWKLEKEYGLKTVYMQLKDDAGHVSPTVSDTIKYQSSDPDEHTVIGEEDETLDFSVSDFVFKEELKQVKITSLPDHGELQLDGEEVEKNQEIEASELDQLTFVPDRNWNGDTELGWAGSGDGEKYSRPARIVIRIDAVNDAPVARAIRLTTQEGKPVNGTFEATDVDQDTLTYRILKQPKNGRVESNAQTGKFRYYPQSGHYDEVTFTYEAFDGVTASEEATVTVANKKPSKRDREEKPTNNGNGGNGGNSGGGINDSVVDVDGTTDNQVVEARIVGTKGNDTLSLTFDEKRMNQWTEKTPSQRMAVTPKDSFEKIKLTFSAKSIQKLKQTNKGIDFITKQEAYQLPLEHLDIEQIRTQLGSQDFTVTIEINETSEPALAKIKESLGQAQSAVIIAARGYQVKGMAGNQSVEVNRFGQYVQTRIELPSEAGHIDTAVMLLPDGSVQPVPTKIVQEGGKQIAIINSMINGELAFISNPKQFSDMTWHWAANDVNELASRLIVNGVDGSRFAPDRSMNRAEFTTILARGLGLWSHTSQGSFHDISSQDWFSHSVDTVAGYNLVSGYGDASFRPNQEISRQEAMVLIARAMKLVGIQKTMSQEEVDRVLAAYSDGEQISSWARESVALCVSTGIAMGNRNKLTPEGSVTRAQMSVMVLRLLQKM